MHSNFTLFERFTSRENQYDVHQENSNFDFFVQTEITTSDDDGSMETVNLVTTADGLDESTNDTTDESAMNLETTTTVLSGSKLQCLRFLMAPLRLDYGGLGPIC